MRSLLRDLMPPPALALYRRLRHRIEYGDKDHRAVFQQIYDRNSWGNGESRSGDGSTLESTAQLRGELAHWLARHPIDRFVDLPCGDFNWMRHTAFPPGVKYLGLDIIAELIAQNQSTYGDDRHSFAVCDILQDELPVADVYFCKDIFIHFPNDAIALATGRVRARTRYLMATTYSDVTRNLDIPFGFARHVNLALLLGPPIELLKDFDGVQDRHIGVWRGLVE